MIPDINWLVIYPEIAICVTAAIVLIVDLMLPARHKRLLALISIAGVVVAMQLVFRYFDVEADSFFRMIVNDSAGSFFKTVFLIGTLLTLFLSITYQKREFPEIGEFYTLILLATFGMMVCHSQRSTLSLSPNCVGERVRVRGHVVNILLYHPSPLSSPLKGRGIL